MNKKEQQLFVAFFQEIHQTEAILDFIKLQLTNTNGYNPNLLFDLLSEKSQSISRKQLKNYLNQKVAYNEREIYQIFERFDWSRQGFISRVDFLNQLTPFVKAIESQKLTGGTITSQIEGHFISLFIQILKRFRIQEIARKQIAFIPPHDAFAQINYLKSGFIGISDLRKLFQQNDFNITNQELYYLLHGLRRRSYKDVNLQVLCENLNPLQFEEYLAYASLLEEEKQKQFLSRSRREEQTMMRQRLQAQQIQHEFQKAQRKKQAQMQRQHELEDRINRQIIDHEQQKQRQIRRAYLQEDKQIRHIASLGIDPYHQQKLRNLQQVKYQKQYLNLLRLKEEQQNAARLRQSINRQKELANSRRPIEFEKQRIYKQEIQNSRRAIQLSRQRLHKQELQNSRKTIQVERQRLYWQNLEILKERQQYKYIQRLRQVKMTAAIAKQIELSRRRLEEESLRERQNYYTNHQLEQLRAREQLYCIVKNSKMTEYEKQLEQTRYEIAKRRSRLAQTLSNNKR